jgi:hypothetical protein
VVNAAANRRMAGRRGTVGLPMLVCGLIGCLTWLAMADGLAEPGELLASDAAVKKRSLWLAFLMLAGIIIGGTLLLTLVVMWGNRTRRLARKPLPPVAQRDELWFLKPKPDVDGSTGEIDQAPTDA